MSNGLSAEEMARLAALLSRATGGAVGVRAAHRLTGGAASATYAVAAERDGSAWPLILQRAAIADAPAGLRKASQAQVQQLAARHGLPVAAVVAVAEPDDGLGDAFVMERVEGESLAPRYLRGPGFAAARAAMTAQCAQALARLHAVPDDDAAGLGLDGQGIVAHLAAYRDLYRALAVRRPVLDYALDWLDERLTDPDRLCLVHGDFRSGNFIINDNGLSAILDWELAHIGDPYEDLGWLCCNAWRFGEWRNPVGGFGQREDVYAAYEAAGGAPIDPARARLFETWSSLRWAIMCLQMAHAHVSGQLPSLERAAIGRRVTENEADILWMIRYGDL